MAYNWRKIVDNRMYEENRYVVLAGEDRVVDKVDDIHYAKKLADETIDGRVFDLFEDRTIY
jgi:hypothetical protein